MFNKVKGIKDYELNDIEIRNEILDEFLYFVEVNCFNLIEILILESVDLYKRSVVGSDIVNKEMYEFIDKGDRKFSLRLEGIAGFIRVLIENKWYVINEEFWLIIIKFVYYGLMFRYE